MEIKVLGMGCASCNKLVESVKQAVKELGIDTEVKKIEDVAEIMRYGVMKTPALVVNEKVKAFGNLLSVAEVKAILQSEQ